MTRRPGKLNSQQPQAINTYLNCWYAAVYTTTLVLHCDRECEDYRQWWQVRFYGRLPKEIVSRLGGDATHNDEKKSTCLLTNNRADEDDEVTVTTSAKVRHPRMTIFVQVDDLVMLMPW
jgi:hypothetical protein